MLEEDVFIYIYMKVRYSSNRSEIHGTTEVGKFQCADVLLLKWLCTRRREREEEFCLGNLLYTSGSI